MRKRWKWLILLGCTAFACGLGLTLMRNREPSYAGRRLSEWLTLYAGDVEDSALPPDHGPAANAIRHIGTNALPYLLDWMDATTDWRSSAAGLAEKPPDWMKNTLLRRVPTCDDRQVQVANATVAFGALGPIGTPAISELTRRTNLTNSPARRDAAILALSLLAPSPGSQIMTTLSNREHTARVLAVTYIRNLGTNARPFVPLLVNYLQTNDNGFASMISAMTLGELNFDPDLAVPALTTSLTDGKECIRLEASRALMQFGKFARPSLPALSIATNDPDPRVRAAAAKALERIAAKSSTEAAAQ